VLGVDRMEVRRVVISEVHVDRYPVELTQPRHPNNLRRPKALLWSHLTRGEEGRSAITTHQGQQRIWPKCWGLRTTLAGESHHMV
jgi:hypothetical protein